MNKRMGSFDTILNQVKQKETRRPSAGAEVRGQSRVISGSFREEAERLAGGRTYAVLIVHVVDLVDSQPLPLVQLLFLECK